MRKPRNNDISAAAGILLDNVGSLIHSLMTGRKFIERMPDYMTSAKISRS
jgi:hypothetical protein